MTPHLKAVPQRYRWVLALIALAPFVSGLIMLDPDRAMILGLASLSIMVVPAAMLILWPEARQGLLPRGRLAMLCGLVMVYTIWLAFTRAPHPGFSLMTVQFWLGAMVAGRMIQQAVRAHGQAPARAAYLAILLAGPLYIPLLPLMEIFYSAQIHWSFDMPGFNHVRKMGHMLTASATIGIGLVAMGALAQGSPARRIAIGALATLALALVLWTGARGAWLAVLAGCTIAMLGAYRTGWRIHWRAVLVMLIVAIVLALLIPSPGRHLGLMEELSSSAARVGDLNALSSSRLNIWANALNLIEQQPWAGYGWGQLALIQNVFPIPQAHNLPLELMLGLGVPMGLLALGLMLALWFHAHRQALRAGIWALPALCTLNTMAFYSLVSGTYYYGVPVVMTGLVWGICLAAPPKASPAKIQALFQ